MLAPVLYALTYGNAFPTGPFLVLVFGFVVATYGHIAKSKLLIVVGLACIAGVSVYVLWVVRPPG